MAEHIAQYTNVFWVSGIENAFVRYEKLAELLLRILSMLVDCLCTFRCIKIEIYTKRAKKSRNYFE